MCSTLNRSEYLPDVLYSYWLWRSTLHQQYNRQRLQLGCYGQRGSISLRILEKIHVIELAKLCLIFDQGRERLDRLSYGIAYSPFPLFSLKPFTFYRLPFTAYHSTPSTDSTISTASTVFMIWPFVKLLTVHRSPFTDQLIPQSTTPRAPRKRLSNPRRHRSVSALESTGFG